MTAVNATRGDLYKETQRKKVMTLFTANYSDSNDELEADDSVSSLSSTHSMHQLPHKVIAESRRRRLDEQPLHPEEAGKILLDFIDLTTEPKVLLVFLGLKGFGCLDRSAGHQRRYSGTKYLEVAY